MKRHAELERSAAAPRGAQAVLRRAELVETMRVQFVASSQGSGGRSGGEKFVALVSDAETALHGAFLQQNGLFLSFPYVCPEPVLATRSVFYCRSSYFYIICYID